MILFLFFIFSFSAVKDPAYDDFDNLELVERLIKDNQIDLAEQTLRALEKHPRPPKPIDVLRGKVLIAQARTEWSQIPPLVTQAQRTTQASKVVLDELLLVRAKSWFFTNNFSQCENDFNAASDMALTNPKHLLLWAQCSEGAKNISKSWDVYRTATSLFPGNIEAIKNYVSFLVRQQLIQVGLEESFTWLKQTGAQRSESENTRYVLTLAEVFSEAQRTSEALQLLEYGRVLYPLSTEINLTLAQNYFLKKYLLAVAEGFERAALRDSKYAYHASEVFRQLGLWERVYYNNLFNNDPDLQIKSRVAAMVDKSQYAQIFAAGPSVQRSTLIDDDEVKYAIGYSFFQLRETEKSLGLLRLIRQRNVLNKSLALQKIIAQDQDQTP